MISQEVRGSRSAWSIVLRSWEQLPVVVRAVFIAFLVLTIGQLPPGVFLLLNLELSPSVPWFLPATAMWLGLFWYYLDGHGRPAATAQQRHQDLRARAPSARVWMWSLLAGGLGMACVMSVALLTGRTAEEAAFRGYLLSQIQRRHGWVVGIGIAAVLFYLAHLSHAYATIAFVPFFMLYSIVHGLLVFFTRSILPSVVLHALGDFVMLPIQYGVVQSPLGPALGTHVIAIGAFALAGILAFLRLAAISGNDRS